MRRGESRGRSDPNIDNGIPAEKAAGLILDGLAAGAREIVVAEGRELAGLQMRATNPELVFAATASEGARLAALREQAGGEFAPEPGPGQRLAKSKSGRLAPDGRGSVAG